METLKKFSQFIQKRADEKAANEKVEMIKKLGEEAYLKLQEAEIKSDDEFKEYVFTVLKKAFGNKFDQAEAQKVVDGLLDKKEGDDYGALIGRLTSSLGEKINDPNNPNPEGYPAPGGESDDVLSSTEEDDFYESKKDDDDDEDSEADTEDDDEDSEADTEDEEDDDDEDEDDDDDEDDTVSEDTASEIEDEIVAMSEPTEVEGDGEKLVTDEQPIDTKVKSAASKSGEGGDPEIKTGGDGSETAAVIAADIMTMGKPKSVKGEGEELVTDEQPIDKDVKGETPEAGEGGEAEMKPISGDDSKEIEKEIVDMGEPTSIEKEAGKLVGERFIMSFDRFIAESRKNN